MPNVIQGDIQNFILKNIDSIAQLEGLLLFHAEPGLVGSESVVSKRLYIPAPEALELLEHLAARGFLKKTTDENGTTYRYQPAEAGDAEMIARLAEAYARYLVPVTNLVHAKHKNKIQKFADAFWIRKEKE